VTPDLDARPDDLDDLDVYRALVESIPAIFYIDRPDELSTNFYTSPQAVDLLGYTQDEWGTTPALWIDRIHPDDRARVSEENERANRVGDRFFSEYRMLAKDGRIVWLRDEAVYVVGTGTAPHWRGIMLDITAQKEAEEKLRWSLEVLRRTLQERRELAQRLESAQEEERRRIAADIHDDPIQAMSAVDLRLQLLAASPEKAAAPELTELHETVTQSIERLRSLLFELRPTALDREGLIPALNVYLAHTGSVLGWSFEVVDALDAEPPPEMRAVLYRVAQEAVTNARTHAGATRVDVNVTGSRDGVTIEVRDDGRGFDVEEAMRPRPGHLGLSTMIERAELLGGRCHVSSAPGRGTVVTCWLPWEAGGPVPGAPPS
jgi:PAS domain S-box-containing protein